MPIIELIAANKQRTQSLVYIDTDHITAIVADGPSSCNVHVAYMTGAFSIQMPALELMSLYVNVATIVRPTPEGTTNTIN